MKPSAQPLAPAMTPTPKPAIGLPTNAYGLYTSTMDTRWIDKDGNAAFNFGRYDNPKVTEALNTYASASSDEERTEALRVMQTAFVEDIPASKLDLLIPLTTFLNTIPYFWLGLLAITVFSVNLGWFPIGKAFGVGKSPEWSWEFISSVIHHGTLPALTIVLASLGGWMLGMRNMMLTVLDEDYITVAQAKGMPNSRVLWRYAARNAVLPQIQSFALSLGFIVGGTVVMEMVFSYPGVGKMLLDATNAKDYALMQGVFLIITLSVLFANIAADVAYAFLDPRTRQTEA